MEGFDLIAGELKARPGLELVVGPQPVMSPTEFQAHANATALDHLDGWPRRESLGVAFVVQRYGTEVVGGAGLLVDPDDADAWADAVGAVLDDAGLREQLAAVEAREQAREPARQNAPKPEPANPFPGLAPAARRGD